jgi:hypothetical protein
MSINQAIIDEAVGAFVLAAKQHFETQRKNAGYESIWRNAENSYFNRGDDYYSGLSRVRIPFLHNKVETIVPKIDKAIFPADGNWMEAVADNPEDDVQVETAKSAELLLKDQLRDIGIRTKYTGMYRSDCIYGTVWAKTKWEHILKKKYARVNGERVTQWTSVFDNPDTYSPSIWDVYADIRDEDLNGLVIERIVKDYQELLDGAERTIDGNVVGVYKNVKDLKETKATKQTTNSTVQGSDSTKGLGLHEYGPHEHKIITYECWGPMPLWFFTASESDRDEKLMCEGFVVIAEGGDKKSPTLLLKKENPLDHQEKPYQRARYIRVDGRLYGIGMMEPNVPMEAELNTLRNQLMDMRTFNLRPKWLLDVSAKINHAALKDLSEQIIETMDVNGLQPLRPNDFSASALANEASIKSDLAETTGGSPLTAGFAGGNSIERTAVGVSTLASSALDRFDLVVTNFVEEIIRPQLKQMWALNQQFLPEGRDILITGKPLVRVMPKDIALPNINFVGVQGGADKQMRINSANILIQNLSPFMQVGIDPVPLILEQVKLMGWGSIIPQIDKRPNSDEMLEQTPEGEAQLLSLGRKVKIDFDDDHEKFILVYDQMLANKDIPGIVRMNIENAKGQRMVAMKLKRNPEVLDAVMNNRKMLGAE